MLKGTHFLMFQNSPAKAKTINQQIEKVRMKFCLCLWRANVWTFKINWFSNKIPVKNKPQRFGRMFFHCTVLFSIFCATLYMYNIRISTFDKISKLFFMKMLLFFFSVSTSTTFSPSEFGGTPIFSWALSCHNQTGYEIESSSSLENCSAAECSEPILRGVSCSPGYFNITKLSVSCSEGQNATLRGCKAESNFRRRLSLPPKNCKWSFVLSKAGPKRGWSS